MLPLPGVEPASFPENAIPTLLSAASSVLPIGVEIPTATQTFAAALTTATAIANSYNSDTPPPDPENGECRLLGPFALIVQGALGGLALLALVYKRWRERPQRPLKIWAFDVSKQVVGSVLVHIANLLMSMLSSGQFGLKISPATVSVRRRVVDATGQYRPNPCSFYLLNLAIDTTVGIPILIVLLRIYTALFAMTAFGRPRESIQSGNYGNPPRAMWWFKQSIIYFLGLMGMKFCVLIIFLILPWISRVGDWALGWTEGNTLLQVLFVMLIFPVIMNATQYYIIDSFIKNQKPGDHEEIPSEEDEGSSFDDMERDGLAYDGPQSGSSDEINSGDEDDDTMLRKEDSESEIKIKAKDSGRSMKDSRGKGRSKELKNRSKDYDPLYDGDSSPTVVGSSSTSVVAYERGQLLHNDSGHEETRAGHK